MSSAHSLLKTVPASLVTVSLRRPWLTLALALLVTIAALLTAMQRMAITTDTSQLISPDVAWRVEERRMEEAFPQLRDVMLVLIDGKTPELAEDGAARLSAALAADSKTFRRVTRPDGGDFLAREGLLFGSVEDVRSATRTMVDAQPLLGPLAADPSLRGVAGSLSTMLDGVNRGEVTLGRIDKPLNALATAIDGSLAGKNPAFSWQELFDNGSGGGSGGLAVPKRRLILVQPVLDHAALMAGENAADGVMRAARELKLDEAHGVRVRLTGEVPLADEEFATLQENIGAVAMVMLGAMLLTLWLATRSVKLVAAIMVAIIAGLIVTAAVGLLAVGRFNLISVAFIPLFVGLGVDFGIQICVRFNAERPDSADAAEALKKAASELGAPLSLAAGAIFVGFGAFLPTAYIGITELGVIAGLGMIIALFASLTLLPALIVVLGPSAPRHEVGFPWLAPVDRLLERKRRWVLWSFALAMGLSIAALPWVQFDFNPLHLRDPNAPAMRTLSDLTQDPDRTPNTIDVLAKTPAEAQALKAKLERLPEVSHVVALGTFIPDDQDAKLAVLQDASLLLDVTLNPFDVLPAPTDADMIAATEGTRAKLAAVLSAHPGPDGTAARKLDTALDRLAKATPEQRSAVDRMLTAPLGVMLNQMRSALQAEPITRESLPADFAQDWETPSGLSRLQVFPSGDAHDNRVLRRFRDAVAKVTPSISGLPVATQAAASTVAFAFVEAGIIAFVLVSGLLFLVLRSVREVAFTLAPVILSIFLTLGSCLVIGQPINFANIIAFPLLFGVGVAFHIYFVMAWSVGAQNLLQSSLARAVMFSAFATGTAFGSLWLSTHPGTASMGKILMISLIWTLICALIFEPALLGPSPEARSKRA
ncbi:MMPL family transporter [Novosphingobium sp. AAP93]|uniref:MMPL family transporter n=1 Tax=Novosphingobium sp. AAP93 TaxID=1523427 RepID=UPI000AE3326D|nr:MMPL family transporter [Novosphingobium sp. AAP93]